MLEKSTRETIPIPSLEYQEVMVRIEEALRASDGCMTTEDFKTEHSFAHGMYIRKTYVPKGCIFLTYIHKNSHPAVHVGDVTMVQPTGNKRFRGVHTFITPAGTQRVCYANEDSYCMTVHLNPDNGTDIKKIEENIYACRYSELFIDQKKETICQE